jgi:hypothetical protein
LKRHGQAASSGSKTKAPGSAGGYLLARYVEEYNTAPFRLVALWSALPEWVMLVRMEALNDPEVQNRMFDFVGIRANRAQCRHLRGGCLPVGEEAEVTKADAWEAARLVLPKSFAYRRSINSAANIKTPMMMPKSPITCFALAEISGTFPTCLCFV